MRFSGDCHNYRFLDLHNIEGALLQPHMANLRSTSLFVRNNGFSYYWVNLPLEIKNKSKAAIGLLTLGDFLKRGPVCVCGVSWRRLFHVMPPLCHHVLGQMNVNDRTVRNEWDKLRAGTPVTRSWCVYGHNPANHNPARVLCAYQQTKITIICNSTCSGKPSQTYVHNYVFVCV